MVFKPNYNHQRAERDRAKQAKKEAKLREREDAAAERRKAEQDGHSARRRRNPSECGYVSGSWHDEAAKRESTFVLFDVTYVGWTGHLQPKGACSVLGGLDGDEPAKADRGAGSGLIGLGLRARGDQVGARAQVG